MGSDWLRLAEGARWRLSRGDPTRTVEERLLWLRDGLDAGLITIDEYRRAVGEEGLGTYNEFGTSNGTTYSNNLFYTTSDNTAYSIGSWPSSFIYHSDGAVTQEAVAKPKRAKAEDEDPLDWMHRVVDEVVAYGTL